LLPATGLLGHAGNVAVASVINPHPGSMGQDWAGPWGPIHYCPPWVCGLGLHKDPVVLLLIPVLCLWLGLQRFWGLIHYGPSLACGVGPANTQGPHYYPPSVWEVGVDMTMGPHSLWPSVSLRHIQWRLRPYTLLHTLFLRGRAGEERSAPFIVTSLCLWWQQGHWHPIHYLPTLVLWGGDGQNTCAKALVPLNNCPPRICGTRPVNIQRPQSLLPTLGLQCWAGQN
jgi:hypothetical protein